MRRRLCAFLLILTTAIGVAAIPAEVLAASTTMDYRLNTQTQRNDPYALPFTCQYSDEGLGSYTIGTGGYAQEVGKSGVTQLRISYFLYVNTDLDHQPAYRNWRSDSLEFSDDTISRYFRDGHTFPDLPSTDQGWRLDVKVTFVKKWARDTNYWFTVGYCGGFSGGI